MKENFQNVPFLISSVENHAEIKDKILDTISQMGVNPLTTPFENLTNTDWHLDPNIFRPYYSLASPVMNKIAAEVTKHFDYVEPLTIINYWFQQYEAGDYHNWHVHCRSLFSNVYYVDLPDGAAKTSFKMVNTEFEIAVKEGDVLTFPSCFLHSSKPNTVGGKTVIAFNM